MESWVQRSGLNLDGATSMELEIGRTSLALWHQKLAANHENGRTGTWGYQNPAEDREKWRNCIWKLVSFPSCSSFGHLIAGSGPGNAKREKAPNEVSFRIDVDAWLR